MAREMTWYSLWNAQKKFKKPGKQVACGFTAPGNLSIRLDEKVKYIQAKL
jgi:hypothetical protein